MDLQAIWTTVWTAVEPAMPYVGFVLGLIGRVLIPYLLEKMRSDKPMVFDWIYVRGQLAGAVVALIPTLAGGELLAQIGALGWAAAFGLAYFGADIGRGVQKARTPAAS